LGYSGGKDSAVLLNILYKFLERFPRCEMTAITIDESDEILDMLYKKINDFLTLKVGEDLDHKLIDISLEIPANKELVVNIEISLELSPFSSFNAQEIADEAIKVGIEEADKILPSLIEDIPNKVSE
jgi:hypothetical protein